MFRNFDDAFLPLLKPHVERLVSDTKHDTHECSQRCAAEIIAGLVRGAKHWSFEKVSISIIGEWRFENVGITLLVRLWHVLERGYYNKTWRDELWVWRDELWYHCVWGGGRITWTRWAKLIHHHTRLSNIIMNLIRWSWFCVYTMLFKINFHVSCRITEQWRENIMKMHRCSNLQRKIAAMFACGLFVNFTLYFIFIFWFCFGYIS